MVRKKKGFTLIELLIVVAIIGILAAIAIPNFRNAQIRAAVAAHTMDLRNLRDAFTRYKLDYPKLPSHVDGLIERRPLTTPVAYISVLYFDRFKPKNAPEDQWGGLIHAEADYLSPIYVKDTDPNGWDRLQKTKGLYLWARGPATGDTLFNCGSDYDSSNGIQSAGCFGRVVEGFGKN
ncbi:MAG: prepilin-type N-terminal cleavage/methylation domain-containing protein [bacterium]